MDATDVPIPLELGRLKVRAVHLYRLSIPFTAPRITAHGIFAERETLLVGVETDDACGWGECPAPPRPTYASEFTAGAMALIREVLAPDLLAGRWPSVRGNPMAKAAVSDAYLDASLRGEGRSLLAAVGGAARPRTLSAVSVKDSPAALVDEVGRSLEAGAAGVVLKVTAGTMRRQLEWARENFPELPLAADANGSMSHLDSELSCADEIELLWLAEPCPDLAGTLEVATKLRTPVMLDESTELPGLVGTLVKTGATVSIEVKPARCGGLVSALSLAAEAVEHGFRTAAGGLWETGVGRAYAAVVATLDSMEEFCTLVPVTSYLVDDVVGGEGPRVDRDGRLVLREAPGIGVTPSPEALARFCLESVTIR